MYNDFVIMQLYAQVKCPLFVCLFAFCGFMYVNGSLWSPVCNFDLLMNLLNIHLCFRDIRMFNYKVEEHTHTLSAAAATRIQICAV